MSRYYQLATNLFWVSKVFSCSEGVVLAKNRTPKCECVCPSVLLHMLLKKDFQNEVCFYQNEIDLVKTSSNEKNTLLADGKLLTFKVIQYSLMYKVCWKVVSKLQIILTCWNKFLSFGLKQSLTLRPNTFDILPLFHWSLQNFQNISSNQNWKGSLDDWDWKNWKAKTTSLSLYYKRKWRPPLVTIIILSKDNESSLLSWKNKYKLCLFQISVTRCGSS